MVEDKDVSPRDSVSRPGSIRVDDEKRPPSETA